MFTGIVEEVGKIEKIEQHGENRRITISAKNTPKELGTGQSVSVSGVCLTALDIKPNSFCADLAPETWTRTSFSRIHQGALVNLELPMKADGRFGGHIVQGHVDGVGKLIAFERILDSDGREAGKKSLHHRHHSAHGRTDEPGIIEAGRSGEPRSRRDREIRREDDDSRAVGDFADGRGVGETRVLSTLLVPQVRARFWAITWAR